MTAFTTLPRPCKQRFWNKAAAHGAFSVVREHIIHETKASCLQYLYTLCSAEPPLQREAHGLCLGMDRFLQCRSQIKNRQLATTRVSVTTSVCLSVHTSLRAIQHCQRADRGAADRKQNKKFIDMTHYVPSPDDVFINRLVASATTTTEIVDTGEEKTVTFSHVEVSFPCDDHDNYFDNTKTIGFSIIQNSTVHFRLKS